MYLNLAARAEPVKPDRLSEFLNEFDFRISAFGSWTRNDSTLLENFVVSAYELSYLEKGRIKLFSPSGEHIFADGSLFLFEPFTVYSVQKLYAGDMDLYNIFFEILPEHREMQLLEAVLPSGRSGWLHEEIPDLTHNFRSIYEMCRYNPAGKTILTDGLLRTCFVYMIRANETQQHTALPLGQKLVRQSEIVKQAIRFIQQNIASSIRIDSICKNIGVSESYLYKCFLNITHSSPQRYVLHYKIRKAEQMLRMSQGTLDAVAAQLGFSSGYHLSSTFKKILGLSPHHYFRRYLNDDENDLPQEDHPQQNLH